MGTPRNAYEALGLGAVEVLEEVALADQAANVKNPVRFKDIEYSRADDCHLGVSNGIPGGVPIPAGGQITLQGVPTSPFKPRACVCPSYLQVNLFMVQGTIGPFNIVEGDPVPLASHSEVSLNQFVNWPTVQANSPIRFQVLNADAAPKTNVALDIRGWRLRE
jgi:hypothetical protein